MRVVLCAAIVTAAEEQFLRRASNEPVEVKLAYSPAGCQAVDRDGFVGLVEYTGSRAMTPSTCFNFCSVQPFKAHLGRYFGVRNGRSCWCATLYHGAATKEKCDVDCDGGGSGCGGYEATDVYHIYDCDPPAAEGSDAWFAEKAGDLQKPQGDMFLKSENWDKMTARERLAVEKFFFFAHGKKCGKVPIFVGGEQTKVAKPSACRVACASSANCMGFSYDEGLGQCEYTGDVEAGANATAEEGPTYHCFVKSP